MSTGVCHYNYSLPSWFSINTSSSDDYDVIINVKDPAGDWHGYWETLTQCINDGKCTNVSSGNIDFSYTHPDDGNPYSLANECTPADPWDDGGTVFFGLFGYPADVDGRDGPIFYNDVFVQM